MQEVQESGAKQACMARVSASSSIFDIFYKNILTVMGILHRSYSEVVARPSIK